MQEQQDLVDAVAELFTAEPTMERVRAVIDLNDVGSSDDWPAIVMAAVARAHPERATTLIEIAKTMAVDPQQEHDTYNGWGALHQMGMDSLTTVQRLAESPDPSIRREAVDCLCYSKAEPASLPTMIRVALCDPDHSVRRVVCDHFWNRSPLDPRVVDCLFGQAEAVTP